MKKLLSLITIILLSLALVGCNSNGFFCNINPESNLCNETYVPITGDYEGIIQNKELLTLVDYAEDFDFDVETLHTFSNQNNEDIPYVDVEEFLFALKGGLVNYSVDNSDILKVSYKQILGIVSFYEYYIEIDPVENTIYYNDFNFSDNFNGNSQLEYNSDLYVSDNEYVEGDQLDKTIDLDDYNIITAYENGRYFIPLYLANLLFTGSYINVMEVESELFVIDDFSLVYSDVYDQELEEGANEANIVANSVSYLSLFFDYYYGLKDFFLVESYKDYFVDYGFNDVDTLFDFNNLYMQFILELDDLHTTVYDFGFNGADIENGLAAEGSRYRQFLEVYYDDVCYLREEEFIFTEYDDYYVLELNEFTLDTVDYLTSNLVDINPDKPIFIDLACNSGGSAIAVLEVLTYLTDQPVSLSYDVPATGEKYIQTYDLDESRKLPNDFYVFTSNMTFSAANLFTSMVLDDSLATVIGTETTGGACAVLFTVLPNNLIMTHSSQMALTNAAGEIIEYGVDPDYFINESVSMTETIAYINTYFSQNVNYNIDPSFNEETNAFDLHFQTATLPADFTLVKFGVTLYDGIGAMVNYQEFESTNFDFNYTGNDFQTAEVNITYIYKGILVVEVLDTVNK